jgi:hypothetical protein
MGKLTVRRGGSSPRPEVPARPFREFFSELVHDADTSEDFDITPPELGHEWAREVSPLTQVKDFTIPSKSVFNVLKTTCLRCGAYVGITESCDEHLVSSIMDW